MQSTDTSTMKKLKILDLFSGIGGFSLGLEATGGFETVAFCDIDPYCRSVLKKHWPNVPIFEDIRKLKGTDIGTVDIITGGYPCQPFSVAGKQKGVEDKRHLWPEYFRLIKECRPTWVIGENVSGHIKLGLDSVLEDLESEGYATRTFSISASSIGANHQRERIWIVANSDSSGSESSQPAIIREQKNKEIGNGQTDNTARITSGANSTFPEQGGETKMEFMANSEQSRPPLQQYGEARELEKKISGKKEERNKSSIRPSTCSSDVANSNEERIFPTKITRNNGKDKQEPNDKHFRGCSTIYGGEILQDYWATEPNVGRVANGVPNRVDRLKALGNSLVPQIPFYIGQTILRTYEDNDSV